MSYNYEFLKSKEIPLSRRMSGKHGEFFSSLYAMFPIDKDSFKGLATPWAFMCLCGEYVVQGYSQVARGGNVSCGCIKKKRGSTQGKLKVLRELLNGDCRVALVKEGFNYKSRDWVFHCNICNTERSNLCAWEVLNSGKKFCACSGKVSCNTREEAITDLKNKLSKLPLELVHFPKYYTNKRDCKVKVRCSKCSYINNVSFSNSYRRGCPNCANLNTSLRLSKDTDWFIEKCNEVHNFKYDYSKVVYKKAKEKVEIICHEHKEPSTFWQSPDNHKNKGKGCPECKRLKLKNVHFKLSKVNQNKEVYKNISSGVYVTLMKDGVYKIGITCNLERRHSEIKLYSRLDITNILYKEMNLYEALILENYLHTYFENKQFEWQHEWAGHTECFVLDKPDLSYVLQVVEAGYKEELR